MLLYRIVQWTWGLPQTLVGAVIAFLHRRDQQVDFHGARVFFVDGWRGSMSLGMFIFIEWGNHKARTRLIEQLVERGDPKGKSPLLDLVRHEYGHTIQSLILGPLYLLTVGVSSAVWFNAGTFQRMRESGTRQYGDLWCERWADRLGAWHASRLSRNRQGDVG